MKIKWQIVIIIILSIIISGCGRRYRLKRDEISQTQPWPFYKGDLAATGSAENIGFNGKLDIIWEKSSNDKPAGPLTIYHNQLVYPGTRNKIKFYNKLTGKYAGRIKPKGTPQTGLVMNDSLAYFAVAPPKNLLKCVNLLNGKIIWRKQLKDASSGSIITNNRLYIGSVEGILYAFESETGNLVWKYQSESKFNLPPAYYAGKIYQPGDNGTVYVLDVDNGSELFQIETEGPIVSELSIGQNLFTADLRGNIKCFDFDNGTELWKTNTGHPIRATIAVDENNLYVAHSGGKLTAYDSKSGNPLWHYDAADVIKATVLIIGDYLVFGTMTGDLYSLNTSDGTLVAKRKIDGAIAASPVTDGKRIYVATEKGNIICFGDYHESIQTLD